MLLFRQAFVDCVWFSIAWILRNVRAVTGRQRKYWCAGMGRQSCCERKEEGQVESFTVGASELIPGADGDRSSISMSCRAWLPYPAWPKDLFERYHHLLLRSLQHHLPSSGLQCNIGEEELKETIMRFINCET